MAVYKGRMHRTGKHRIRTHKVWLLLLTVMAVLTAAAFFLYGRRKGGSQIRGMSYYESVFPVESYADYLQNDARWMSSMLGGSRDTMGGSGCLTCCIAASLKAQGIYDYTPGELNELFNANDVYNENGAIVWGSLEQALPFAEVRLDYKTNSSNINQLLEEGRYPIVKVRRRSGAVHWIMLTGTEEGTYDIAAMDPIDGNVHMSDYNNRIYGVRVVTSTDSP